MSGFPDSSVVKNLPTNAGDTGSIPGLGRSPGEGNGNSLQYSCLGNPTERGTWQATVHGVTKGSDSTQPLNNNKALYLVIFSTNSYLRHVEWWITGLFNPPSCPPRKALSTHFTDGETEDKYFTKDHTPNKWPMSTWLQSSHLNMCYQPVNRYF